MADAAQEDESADAHRTDSSSIAAVRSAWSSLRSVSRESSHVADGERSIQDLQCQLARLTAALERAQSLRRREILLATAALIAPLASHVRQLAGDTCQDFETLGQEVQLGQLAATVTEVTGVMGSLLRRATSAERTVKEVKGQLEACQVAAQERAREMGEMWEKVAAMEKSARATGSQLQEMQNRLSELSKETKMQRQRAVENEVEIASVRSQVSELRGGMEQLATSQETISVLENQLREMGRTATGLSVRLDSLESLKDLETASLQSELDVKEAELMAMGDQLRLLAQFKLRIEGQQREAQKGGTK